MIRNHQTRAIEADREDPGTRTRVFLMTRDPPVAIEGPLAGRELMSGSGALKQRRRILTDGGLPRPLSPACQIAERLRRIGRAATPQRRSYGRTGLD